MNYKVLFTVIAYFMIESMCLALDVDTHKYINNAISKKLLNKFSLDGYLKDDIGLQKGIYEQLVSSISNNSLNASE